MTIRTIVPGALRQIDEIFAYIARDSVAAANGVAERIQEVMDLVTESLRIGRKTRESGVRSHPVERHPYVVFYRYVEQRDEVRIIRVRHAAMRRAGLQEDASGFRSAVSS